MTTVPIPIYLVLTTLPFAPIAKVNEMILLTQMQVDEFMYRTHNRDEEFTLNYLFYEREYLFAAMIQQAAIQEIATRTNYEFN